MALKQTDWVRSFASMNRSHEKGEEKCRFCRRIAKDCAALLRFPNGARLYFVLYLGFCTDVAKCYPLIKRIPQPLFDPVILMYALGPLLICTRVWGYRMAVSICKTSVDPGKCLVKTSMLVIFITNSCIMSENDECLSNSPIDFISVIDYYIDKRSN